MNRQIEKRLTGENPPKELQGVLWNSSVKKIDLWKHKAYVIHQVLRYGSFADIKWLFKTYGKNTVAEIFIKQPFKIYTAAAFNYIKNFVLGLREIELVPANYVSTVYDPEEIKNFLSKEAEIYTQKVKNLISPKKQP